MASADCAITPQTPACDLTTGACIALPPGAEIGAGDGTPGSVKLVVIYEPDQARAPTDLAFNPSKPEELWVVNQADESVVVIQKPGQPDQSAVRVHDVAAGHFMPRPAALAFGVVVATWGQTWASCNDSDNLHNSPAAGHFMGPSLWSAEPEVFAVETPGGLGSHLDMLHSTRYCRGIAHVEKNVYFLFNGDLKSLDRYDFVEDHGPGNDDHSDGVILRYVTGLVKGVQGVPSHLIYSPSDGQLHVADTGNARIAKLDTKSGIEGATFDGLEPVQRHYVDGATLVDVVPAGTLEAPSGIELRNDLLYVTDNTTSRFHVFDLTGKAIRQLDTALPPGSLAGLAFGPADGKVYFTSLKDGRVYRIDPLP